MASEESFSARVRAWVAKHKPCCATCGRSGEDAFRPCLSPVRFRPYEFSESAAWGTPVALLTCDGCSAALVIDARRAGFVSG